MHIEICIEDASGEIFLRHMLPKIITDTEITYRVHSYHGIGRLPGNLKDVTDPKKQTILAVLPKLIRGCANTPWIDALVIVVDADSRNCEDFLAELKGVVHQVASKAVVMFRLAIEEMEAWYLGDQDAIKTAYPGAKIAVLNAYEYDSICGTWEYLADAVIAGGAVAIKAAGWPAAGMIKAEWAETITPHMDPDVNQSPSFQKLRDGLRSFSS